MLTAERESPALRAATTSILRWLAETDELPPAPADAIVGFGMFDLTLPRFCGDLYERGAAPRIIFTGGIGAGTGDLGGPEADVWRAELRKSHPQIADDDFVIENRSTNTAENIAFTAAQLERAGPALAFGSGIRSIIIVASPSRLRRVWLTLRLRRPELRVYRRLPPVDFDTQRALYARNRIDYAAHLVGELDRILDYPRRGWIAHEPVPPEIMGAHALLRRRVQASAAHSSLP